MPTRFGRIVTPIYRQLGGDAIVHHGTGVLIKTTDRFWLFTAAHVLEGHRALFLPGESRNIVVPSDRFITCRDPLDLAFTELSPADAADTESIGSKFLSVEHLDGTAGPFPPLRCGILGYPDRSVEVDGDSRKMKVHPTVLSSSLLSLKELSSARLNPEMQIAAFFKGFMTPTGKKLKGFDPRGLSGGAFMCKAGDKVKLVGIATDYDPRRKMIIGTRLRSLLQKMLDVFVSEGTNQVGK
jgi:hypothetical protein